MVDNSSSLTGVFFWEDGGVEFDSKPFMGVHLSWEDIKCVDGGSLVGVEASLPGKQGSVHS